MESHVDARLAALARAQNGILSCRQAGEVGVTRRQLQVRLGRGSLVTVHRGVYRLAGLRPTSLSILTAAVLACGGVASHRSAAALWGLRGCAFGVPEVTVVGRRRPALEGVRGHSTSTMDPADVTVRSAIAVSTPARALVEVATVARHEIVAGALEDALLRGLTTVAEVEGALARAGRRGAGALVSALGRRAARAASTESVLEDRFVALLRRAGLPEPERQVPLAVAGRRQPLRLDFAYRRARLAIELDGQAAHASPADRERDARKSNLAALAGWTLLRYTWGDVAERGAAVAAEVSRCVRAPA